MKNRIPNVKRIRTKKPLEVERGRKASKESHMGSCDEADFIMSEEQNEDQKASFADIQMEIGSESEGDSDRELQIALQEGLLNTERLNYIVPKKRPIINRTAEIREKIAEFAKKLPWIETVDITTRSTLTKEMINNDFDRELQFYQQAEKAVQLAVPRLLSLGIKVIRPSDYYAEMAKSDGHMQKVRKRLLKIQEGKERQEAIRKMREERKYAVMVKKEVLQKRNNEKKQLMEAVKKHKKGMKQQLEDMLNNVKRMDLEQDDDVSTVPRNNLKKFRGATTGRGFDAKKKWKSGKFGYGGKKKGSKRNDRESFENISQRRPNYGIRNIGGEGYRGNKNKGNRPRGRPR